MTDLRTGILVLLSALTAAAGPAWRQSAFMIGIPDDPFISGNLDPAPRDPAAREKLLRDRQSFQTCRNAYFSLIGGTGFDWSGHPCDSPVTAGQAKTDYALSLAAATGLTTFVHHEPWNSCNCFAAFLSFMRTENTAPYKSYDSYAEYIAAHYKNLGARRYAAIQGYFIAAEPSPDDTAATCGTDGFTHGIDTLKKWVSAFNTCSPDKLSFVFIYPSGAVFMRTFPDTTAYKTYIGTVYNDTDGAKRPQVVCSNSYPLFDPGFRPIEDNFFWGLNTCRHKAGDRPLWNYAHCIFTFRDGDRTRDPRLHAYMPPDEATLRWNAFVNIAHGVRGIIWYTYGSVNRDFGAYGNYGDAIIDRNGASPLIAGSRPRRTTYAVIREINRFCACIAGPAIMTSDFVNAYHKKTGGPDARGTYTVFPGQRHVPSCQVLGRGADDPVLRDISCRDAMASVFRDRVDPAVYHLMLVNKNWQVDADPIKELAVTLKGDLRGNVLLYPRQYGYDGNTAPAPLPVSFDHARMQSRLTLPDPLLSGEARMLMVRNPARQTKALTGFRPQGEIAAACNSTDNRLICFARGTDDRLYARVQDTADVDFWGPEWKRVDTARTAGAIACMNFGKGRPIYVFTSSADGKLQYTRQSRPQDRTSPLVFDTWKKIPAQGIVNGNITYSITGNNNVFLIVFFRCGHLLNYVYFNSSGACFGPFPLTEADPIGATAANVGRNSRGAAKGSLDLFAIKQGGRVFRARLSLEDLLKQHLPRFEDFGCGGITDIAVGTAVDSSLEVFMACPEAKLLHLKQRSPGSEEWDRFEETSKAYGWLSLGRNRDGTPEVFSRDSAGYLVHCRRQAEGRPALGRMVRLGDGSITAGPSPAAVAVNGDGRLTLFAACAGNANIFFTSQCQEGCGCEWQNCLPFTNLSDLDRQQAISP